MIQPLDAEKMIARKNETETMVIRTGSLLDVITAARLLNECCLDASILSAQAAVSASKNFAKHADDYLTRLKDQRVALSFEDSNCDDVQSYKVTVYSTPRNILLLLTSSGVVHDSFQSAFQLSLDICFRMHLEVEELSCIADNQISETFEECLHWISTSSLKNLMDLKKIESLVVFISSFFETYFSEKRPPVNDLSPERSLSCLVALLQRMRDHMIATKKDAANARSATSTTDDVAVSAEVEKEIRTCFSDIRASCIATANCIILVHPGWVTADTERCPSYLILLTNKISIECIYKTKLK